MSPIEVESLVNTVHGMSEEQLRLVAQNMPITIMCEEIARRHEVLSEKLNGIASVMGNI
jgi:hypothetical protein